MWFDESDKRKRYSQTEVAKENPFMTTLFSDQKEQRPAIVWRRLIFQLVINLVLIYFWIKYSFTKTGDPDTCYVKEVSIGDGEVRYIAT